MATEINTGRWIVRIRMRWWVQPYLWLAMTFLWTVAWAVDDDALDDFIDRQAAFIGKHGWRFD